VTGVSITLFTYLYAFKHFDMIQYIHPHQFSNQYLQSPEISERDYIFHFRENSLLLAGSLDSLTLPSRKEFNGLVDKGIFLFTLDNTHCFLLEACTVPENPAFGYHEISFFRTISRKEVAWASLVALHLADWYRQNRYCGKCGSLLSPKTDERALICENCGNILFPKISPAIIVAILSNDKILLARGTRFRGSFYSLIAGYADIGESLEETVIREVKEEVGIDVTEIRYYSSQPWPLSGSMMIGFISQADDHQPLTIDPKEIADAGWYTRDNLPEYPLATISIAGEMIEKFRNGMLK
jgi:NAD+ diphosphatase